MYCHLCNSRFDTNHQIIIKPVISSDCSPLDKALTIFECGNCGLIQKNQSDEWRHVCQQIYKNYQIYYQAGGEEQKSRNISTGKFDSRSYHITNFISPFLKVSALGQVLDIGCGNGMFLREFFKLHSDWKIFGSDLNQMFRENITNICSGAEFVEPENLLKTNNKYELVTLIHCLEHISSPVNYLKNLSSLLKDDGVLVIQLPDVENNPFDLTIADHASHFTKSTLKRAVGEAGFDILSIGNQISPNEITLIAKPGNNTISASYLDKKPLLMQSKNWLERAVSLTKQSTENTKIGVFGSSISATWLACQFLENVDFFIDEDLNRVGREHLGRRVILPSQIDSETPVLLALSPQLSCVVKERLKGINWINIDLTD